LLAGLETCILLVLSSGVAKLHKTTHLFAWTIGFLLMVYILILTAMALTDLQQAAFVWLFLMPILAYIMLGRTFGFLLSIPFMLLALANFTFKLAQEQGAFEVPQYLVLSNLYFSAFLVVLFIHIAEHSRAIAQKELIRLASTDPLTGLLNRGQFQNILEQSINAVNEGAPGVAVLILDLDYFKRINDQWGHDAGDQILIQLAQRLQAGVRATDSVCRLGGEEFGILVKDLSLQHCGKLAEELRQLIANTPFHYKDKPIDVSATFGVAHSPQDATSATSLYQMADRRLYSGKETGRNKVVTTDN
ncbi:MAG: GGDEF domain-containing protein, partial [Natronospirillum sp.]